MSAATALVVGLGPACAPPPSPAASAAIPGRGIDTRTPPGLRAQQTMDMLNSEWPIGPVGVGTLASPDRVDFVEQKMEGLWWDRPFVLDGVDISASAATLHLTSSYGARQDIRLHTDDLGRVDGFDLETLTPSIKSFADVDTVLGKTGARYSYQVAKVNDGRCERFQGTNTGESLPLASIFKLYVLDAVATAVKNGTVSWDDQLTVTDKVKAVGSSMDLPTGAQISVLKAAEKMIATSDNMATDMLIGRLGTHAIEQALVAAGNHDPASMTPFPTMYELFSIGWGKPDLRDEWKHATTARARGLVLQEANSNPYQPDWTRAHTPASIISAEWYGNAEDICRVHTTLQADAVGPAAPLRQILAAVSGIQLDRNVWKYIAAKAGGLPGDLTLSWYAVDKTGQAWVVSFQLNWTRDHGPNVTGWLLQVAKQVFGLIAPR